MQSRHNGVKHFNRKYTVALTSTAQKSHSPPGNHHANTSNYLLFTGTDNSSLAGTRVIIKVSGDHYQWLAGGYDLKIGHFSR